MDYRLNNTLYMHIKPFDKALSDQCDPPAKAAMVHFLVQNSYKDIEVRNESPECNIEHIYYDVAGTDTIGIRRKFDVEIKRGWNSTIYPFDDIRIPLRKINSAASEFIVFNAHCRSFFMIPRYIFCRASSICMTVRNCEWDHFKQVDKRDIHIRKYAMLNGLWQEQLSSA